MPETFSEPIRIRYRGLDATTNRLELTRLGQSLQGAARLIGVGAHYAYTGKYVKKSDAIGVRILAAPPSPGSFEVVAFLVALQPTLFHGAGTWLVDEIVTYVLARLGGRSREAEMALEVAEKAIAEQGATSRAALDLARFTLQTMAESQRPAARMYASPVGETCSTIGLGRNPDDALLLDKPTRDAIDAPEPVEIREEQRYQVLISEMDMRGRSCKLSLEQDDDPDKRYAAEITDPVAALPGNPYALAMAAKKWLTVKAKAQIKDGELDRFYISDCLAE